MFHDESRWQKMPEAVEVVPVRERVITTWSCWWMVQVGVPQVQHGRTVKGRDILMGFVWFVRLVVDGMCV